MLLLTQVFDMWDFELCECNTDDDNRTAESIPKNVFASHLFLDNDKYVGKWKPVCKKRLINRVADTM
jgi:hypothetical protein